MQQPPKFSLPQLALIEWLMEKPAARFFIRSQFDLYLYEIGKGPEGGHDTLKRFIPADDKTLLAQLGGRSKFDVHAIYKAGFVNVLGMHSNSAGLARFKARFGRDPFHYSEQVQLPRKEMQEFWEAHGRRQLQELRDRKAADIAAVERLVVLGCDHSLEVRVPSDIAALLPKDFRMPLGLGRVRQPYALARVVKETETRVYVDRVKPFFDIGYRANPVSGSASGTYVERSAIMMDPATPQAMEALAGVFREHCESVEARVLETLREIAPALSLLHSKLAQSSAMYDDLIREVLESHATAGAAPKP